MINMHKLIQILSIIIIVIGITIIYFGVFKDINYFITVGLSVVAVGFSLLVISLNKELTK